MKSVIQRFQRIIRVWSGCPGKNRLQIVPNSQLRQMISQPMNLVRFVAVLVVVVASVAKVSDATAQTTQWANAVGGNWQTAARWTAGVPNGTTNANIAVAGGNYTVTIGADASVSGLTISSPNATLRHTAGILTAGSINVTAGSYRLAGGTIRAANPAAVYDLSRFILEFGTLDGMMIGPNLVIDRANTGGGLTFTGGTSVLGNLDLIDSQLNLQQDFTVGQQLLLDRSILVVSDDGVNPATLTIGDTTGSLVLQGGSIVYLSPLSVLENKNLIRVADASSTYILPSSGFGASLSNEGQIVADVGGQLILTPGVFTNQAAGSVVASNGSTISLGGAWSNAGTFSVDASSRLELGGTFDTAGIGTVNISPGGTAAVTGSWNNTGTSFGPFAPGWSLEGGVITGGTLDPTGLATRYGTLDGVTINNDFVIDQANISGGLTFTGGTEVNANLDVIDSVLNLRQDFTVGQQLSLDRSILVVSDDGVNSATLTIGDTTGSLVLQGGSIVYLSPLSVLENKNLIRVADASSTYILPSSGFGASLSNEGQIVADVGGQLILTPGVFTNQAAGSVVASNGSTISLGGAWSNAGTFSVDASSRLELGGTFDTAGIGTVNISPGGTAAVTGSWNNTGTSFGPFAPGWSLEGGVITGGTLDPTGLATRYGTLDGVTINNNFVIDQANISGGLTFTGGTAVNANLDVVDSVLNLRQDFTVNQQLLVERSNLVVLDDGSNPATLTIGDTTGSLVLQGGGNVYLTPLGVLDNRNLIRVADANLAYILAGYGYGSVLSNEGQIVVDAGGQLNLLPGVFTNQAAGSVVASNGSTISVGGAWSNAGTLSVDGSSRLELGGTFDTAGIGTVNISPGGSAAVTGIWNNSGSSFGPFPSGWSLEGGTITGGTLDPTGLVARYGTLDGVTINNNFVIDQANIAGGLTFTGGTTVNANLYVQDSFLNLAQNHVVANSQAVVLDNGYVSILPAASLEFQAGSVLAGNGYVINGLETTPITIDGTVSPGASAGWLSMQSAAGVNFGPTATTVIELGTINGFAGVPYDQLEFTGVLSLDGDLIVNFIDGFELGEGQLFPIISVNGTASGTFNGLAQDAIVRQQNAFDLRVSYNYSAPFPNVTLYTTVSAIPEPSLPLCLAGVGTVVFLKRRRRVH